jgi:hypothetical protein
LLVAGAAAVAGRADFLTHAPLLCPMRLLTGLRCPLCGMTRASLLLARGDFAAALRIHPLAPLVLALAIGGVLVWWGSVAAGRPVPRWLLPPPWVTVPIATAVWGVNVIWGSG